MLTISLSKQLSDRAAFFVPTFKNFFMLKFFYFVNPFQNFGEFSVISALRWNGRNIAYRLLKNEEPSDSIGIIIAVIIDVNYWLWKFIA